jgi:hypothetical protein
MLKIILILFLTCIRFTSWAQRSFDIQINSTQPTLLLASAGNEPILSGSDLVLGGIPAGLGGTEPYIYQWLPTDNLDNPSIANPIFTGSSSTEYTLIITDSRGCLAADTIQILITGIGNYTEENELKAHPNPGSGRIRIVAPQKLKLEETTVQVFDVIGRIVYTAPWRDAKQEFFLDVSKLANGQYTLMLSDRNTSISNKIIVNK